LTSVLRVETLNFGLDLGLEEADLDTKPAYAELHHALTTLRHFHQFLTSSQLKPLFMVALWNRADHYYGRPM